MRKKDDQHRPYKCPHCGHTNVYRYGVSPNGKQQRYLCRSCKRSFQETYLQSGHKQSKRSLALTLHKEGHTQRTINARTGISFSTIRNIISGYQKGSLLPGCPHCQSNLVCKFGKEKDGIIQRYRCKDCKKTFTSK